MKTTFHSIKIDGITINVPNIINDTNEGYYVSYNNYDTRIYGCDTTAIIIDKTSAFLILNGDHRDSIKGLNLEDVCKYFHNNKDLQNKMTDPHQDFVLKVK